MQVDGGTDFWRVTHYGFIRDNGHFYYQEQAGDFLAKVKVVGHYQALYDQAGLMVRLDEKNWIKTGIEYVKGVQNVSAVVTREVSDWSVVPRQDSPPAVWLTLLRKGDYVEIQYSFDNKEFKMLRLAYFPPAPGQKGADWPDVRRPRRPRLPRRIRGFCSNARGGGQPQKVSGGNARRPRSQVIL
ncbi:MAG: DUF1349 domain-containing protein [Hymenobacter sp.]